MHLHIHHAFRSYCNAASSVTLSIMRTLHSTWTCLVQLTCLPTQQAQFLTPLSQDSVHRSILFWHAMRLCALALISLSMHSSPRQPTPGTMRLGVTVAPALCL
jgi:hypothetical protein